MNTEEFQEAVDHYIGYCTTCKKFTRECTEGDATDYDCEQCGCNTVVGAENAMIMGLLTFEED